MGTTKKALDNWKKDGNPEEAIDKNVWNPYRKDSAIQKGSPQGAFPPVIAIKQSCGSLSKEDIFLLDRAISR